MGEEDQTKGVPGFLELSNRDYDGIGHEGWYRCNTMLKLFEQGVKETNNIFHIQWKCAYDTKHWLLFILIIKDLKI